MINIAPQQTYQACTLHRVLSMLLCGLLMILTSLSPSVGWAQGDDVKRAIELDRRAKQLVTQGEYHKASEVYREALKIFEHPDLFINLARSEMELKEYQSAYSSCVKALSSPLLTPQKRIIATECVTNMQARMSEIRAQVDTYPSGAKLRLDGQPLGQTPWEGQLAPGRRQFDFELEGHEPITRSVNAVAGAHLKLKIRLVPKGMGGVLTLRTVPKGASVMLDNEFIGQSPVIAFPTSKGTHSLQLILKGHLSEIQQVYVGEGGNEEFNFYLKPIRGRVSATDLWPAWGLLSAGIITGVVGGFFGYKALSAYNKARDLAREDGTLSGYEEYRFQIRDLNNASETADILWTTSGVMITSGAIWWLVAR